MARRLAECQVIATDGGALQLGGIATTNGDHVWREADLSSATSATLSFDYKWENLTTGAVSASIEVRANSAVGWTQLATFDNLPFTYQNFSADISAHTSATTQVRFVIEQPEVDSIHFDNLQNRLRDRGPNHRDGGAPLTRR